MTKRGEEKANSDLRASSFYEQIETNLLQTEEGLAFAGKQQELVGFNIHFQSLYLKITGKPVRKNGLASESLLFESVPGAHETLQAAFQGKMSTIEGSCRATGTEVAFTIKLEPALDENNLVAGVFLRLSLDAPVRPPQLDFRTLLESSGDAVVILSPEGKATYVSPSVEKVLGYSREEMMQMDLYSILHPDDLFDNQKVMERAIFNPGVPMRGHVSRLLHKDGTYHWYDATVVNMLNDPNIAGIVDNIREIPAPETAADEKEKYELALSAGQIGTWEIELDGQVWTRDERFNQIFGCNPAPTEWGTEVFFLHIYPEDRPAARRAFYQSLREGTLELNTRIILPDKKVKWVELKGGLLTSKQGGPGGKMAGTVLDVTELQSTREALVQSEHRLKKLAERLPNGLVITNQNGDPIYWNEAALRMHGFAELGEGIKKLPELLTHFKLYEDGKPLSFKNWPIPRLMRDEEVSGLNLQVKSLREGWNKIFRYSGDSFPDVFGNQVHFLTISEISGGRGEIKKATKQHEERFWEAFHLSPVALTIIRKKDGVCLDLNSSAEELLGHSFDEYEDREFLSLNHVSEFDFHRFLEVSHGDGLYSEIELKLTANKQPLNLKVLTVEQLLLEDEECRLAILIDLGVRQKKR